MKRAFECAVKEVERRGGDVGYGNDVWFRKDGERRTDVWEVQEWEVKQ